MKRLLTIGGLVTAALLAPATAAHADHICVTSGGNPVVCAPDPEELIANPNQICVKYGSTNLVCVF